MRISDWSSDVCSSDLLPEILAQEARAIAHKHNAPARMRTAVAVEILLIASIRRENLVTPQLGESIKRVGAFPNPYWIIEIDAENVKNDRSEDRPVGNEGVLQCKARWSSST